MSSNIGDMAIICHSSGKAATWGQGWLSITFVLPPAGGVAVGVWTAIKHCSKSLGFNLPIRTGSVLLKFGFDVQSQTEFNQTEIQYGCQVDILKGIDENQ